MLRRLLILGGLSLLAAGCNYYQVSDPTTGRAYYTRAIIDHPGGAVSFTDARTGDDVTLQNHETTKITRDQYDAAKRATITVVPAPVPPPVPAGTVITPGNRGTDVKPPPNPNADPDDSDVRVPMD
jgi:hypothetical protein